MTPPPGVSLRTPRRTDPAWVRYTLTTLALFVLTVAREPQRTATA